MKFCVLNSAPPPDSPIFFLDRCLGQHVVASALREAGHTVEVHNDHFKPDAADTDWIPVVGAKGWIILTKDKMILARGPELAAVAQGTARLYALSSGQATAQQMVVAFLKAIPKIKASLKQQRPPYAAKIDAVGKVTIVLTRKDLLHGPKGTKG
jgi:hypothetical protein